jgi:predicted nuclease of predicted toxin-antitoxin system
VNFVADEGIDRQTVEHLRQAGYTVWAVSEMSPGISDNEVFDIASRENAVLLTADRDFGRISWGIILVRLAGMPPARRAELVTAAIRRHEATLPNVFAVISPGAIRLRQLPEASAKIG